MSILLQRNSNVHRGILSSNGPLGADMLKFHDHAHFVSRTKREHICKLQIGLGAEIGARQCPTTNFPIAYPAR
jgi:hypothetical protein